VPNVGLEPTRPKTMHFECTASANSANSAHLLFKNILVLSYG
jgi:hypothetical protein